MVYSDVDIVRALDDGYIAIEPAPDRSTQIGSCSVDLRLGNRFRVFNHSRIPFIDARAPAQSDALMTEVTVADGEPFILQPGDFVLATSMETVTLPPTLLARLEGRSSLGRMGIVVHSTASVFDPGWHGVAVLELGNLGRLPVSLYPGMRVCAMTFEELKTPTSRPYVGREGAKYVNQDAPVASRIGQDRP
jgi:dCTP deaminase